MASLSWKITQYLSNNSIDATAHFGHTESEGNIVLFDDGSGVLITKWDAAKVGIAQPAAEQLNAVDSDADIAKTNDTVRNTRKIAYGDIGDQLDEIYKDIDAWKVRIQGIKDSNPKS